MLAHVFPCCHADDRDCGCASMRALSVQTTHYSNSVWDSLPPPARIGFVLPWRLADHRRENKQTNTLNLNQAIHPQHILGGSFLPFFRNSTVNCLRTLVGHSFSNSRSCFLCRFKALEITAGDSYLPGPHGCFWYHGILSGPNIPKAQRISLDHTVQWYLKRWNSFLAADLQLAADRLQQILNWTLCLIEMEVFWSELKG